MKPKPDPGRLLGNVNSSSRQMGNVAPLKGSYGKGGVHVPHVLGLTENSASRFVVRVGRTEQPTSGQPGDATAQGKAVMRPRQKT